MPAPRKEVLHSVDTPPPGAPSRPARAAATGPGKTETANTPLQPGYAPAVSPDSNKQNAMQAVKALLMNQTQKTYTPAAVNVTRP